MRVTFWGAARTVTGSKHLLTGRGGHGPPRLRPLPGAPRRVRGPEPLASVQQRRHRRGRALARPHRPFRLAPRPLPERLRRQDPRHAHHGRPLPRHAPRRRPPPDEGRRVPEPPPEPQSQAARSRGPPLHHGGRRSACSSAWWGRTTTLLSSRSRASRSCSTRRGTSRARRPSRSAGGERTRRVARLFRAI